VSGWLWLAACVAAPFAALWAVRRSEDRREARRRGEPVPALPVDGEPLSDREAQAIADLEAAWLLSDDEPMNTPEGGASA